MTSKWATREHSSDPPSTGPCTAELVFFAVGSVAFAIAVILGAFEQSGRVQLPRGVYAILAALMVIGVCGWTIIWVAGYVEVRARRRTKVHFDELRNEMADHFDALRTEMAELTSAMQKLADRVSEQVQQRQRPASAAAACRPVGHMYVSGPGQGEAAAARPASVEAPTDPSGSALQQAREDGMEQGFDLGYRAQLADRGVTPLPRPRRPRLTGDS